MGGAGGGGYFGRTSPSEIARITREAQDKDRAQEFEVELASLLRDKLTNYNSRDTDAIGSILDDVKHRIQDAIAGSVDLLFGGSIAKHTYLKGLSDVDCLVLLDRSFSASTPSQLKAKFAEALQARYGANKVWMGTLAVTIEAAEHTIQLLPAIRAGQAFKISATDGQGWSRVNPQRFANKLKTSNDDLSGKLVPTIKLAKGVLGSLPEGLKPSGYHVESMAINIFRGYHGSMSHQDMLRHFLAEAPDHILKPVNDSTGQSVHVDDSLGPAGSPQRQSIARALDRINRRVKNADAAQSLNVWRDVMGSEIE
jgi:hypothetical protein